MSANGALTSTLDYSYVGGGVVRLSGLASSDFDLSLDFTGVIPLYGTIEPVTIDFTLTDAGVETPTIQASATDLSFGFTASSTIEYGVQKYLTVPWGNISTSFTANSAGEVVVSGIGDVTLDLNLNTHIYVFSEGPGSVSFGYTVAAKGVNASTHIYNRVGTNGLKFIGVDYNGTRIPVESNGVKLVSNGVTHAEIIQN